MTSLLPASLSARKSGYGSLGDAASAARPKTGPSEASLFSKLLFSYANPMMAEGNRRQLDNDDLWELEGKNKTADAYAVYRRQFDRCNQSVFRTIFATYGGSFVLYGLAILFSMACGVFAPAVLHHVIDAFTAPQLAIVDLSIWLVAFFASKIVNALVSAQMRFHIEILALRLVVSMKSLLFEKATRRRSIKTTASESEEAADIANLMSSDVENVLWAAFDANSVWVLPIQIVAIVVMLYYVLDLAAFAGLAVICISMLASFLVAKREADGFEDVMEREDVLMRTVKEVFGAIQIVKLNAWESKFGDKIRDVRADELKATMRFMYISATNVFLLWVAPVFVSMTSFAVYSITMGQQLTAAKVFTAMALFNALREPLQELPNVVSRCVQAKVSLDRMQEFLSVEEYEPGNIIRDGSSYPTDVTVDIKDGTFGWNKDTTLLKNVNMTVKKGDLVVVHGSVGAGKSSLCSALLGEMDKLSGSVFVRGRVAYYSQQTWIQNMTIRDNILFGKAYDEKLYQRVLDACGLLPDLEGFPAGDSTEIGQKGVNLSGGQKARLCLARACYADADVLILDSPLAAVDAVVQSEIFSKCLCTLLESKTVVLVTHAPDIIASEAANYKLEVVDGVVSGERRDPGNGRATYVTRVSPRKVRTPTEEAKIPEDADAGRLVEDEEREDGRVSMDVFFKYFNALGGKSVCIFICVTQIVWQAFQIGSDFWLSHWTGQNLGVDDEEKTAYNLKIYVFLGLGSACLVLVREITVATTGLKAAKDLFNAMTRALLHSPMRFFDANPIGRIINRYGDDMSAVDFRLPFSMGAFLATFFSTACQLAAAVYTVNALGILIVPLLYVYVKIANFYLAPSREISRLTKIADSPVLSHVTSCEEGIALLRAFGPDHVRRSILENCRLNDVYNKVWFANAVLDHWFQVRMELIGCGLVIFIVSMLVSLHDELSPGIVGLAFTYALSVDAGLSEVVYCWSWVEICMVSPERILEYASLPSEGDSKMLQIEPSPQWPQTGTIDFDDVVFSYKEGAPPVLKGLSFSIKNNEKIGIVGRTGAGKSSLTMALFRINELVSGSVTIDGVDISTMPLKSLRSHLSIIPQSPVLFKGTLRAYMDPFDDFSDDEIWTAFEKVEMKEQITALEGQLVYELSENGENFSVGERQMLCMARAMLTKARIVVMDEATSSIDHATEKKLQHMINRNFQEATVLTIAHRLATVLDSDRIVVLSDGRVVEFDTPQNLVKNEGGIFYELAQEGGYLELILADQ